MSETRSRIVSFLCPLGPISIALFCVQQNSFYRKAPCSFRRRAPSRVEHLQQMRVYLPEADREEWTGLRLPCRTLSGCARLQGGYQKVNVPVPPAAILRVLSFFSERGRNYSFQEQLPDGMLAGGRHHPAVQNEVPGRQGWGVSHGLEPFRGVVLGSCLQCLWFQPALTDLDHVLTGSLHSPWGPQLLSRGLGLAPGAGWVLHWSCLSDVFQVPVQAPSLGQEVSESCSLRGGSRGMLLFLPCFQYFDVMRSTLPVAVFWEQIGKLWLVASAWQLTSHTAQAAALRWGQSWAVIHPLKQVQHTNSLLVVVIMLRMGGR